MRHVESRRRTAPPRPAPDASTPRPTDPRARIILSTLPLILLLPILIVLSGTFSGAETALFSLTHTDRQRLARMHAPAARAVEHLLAGPRRLLILVLLLNMTVNVAYFAASAVLSTTMDSRPLAIAVSIGALLAIILLGEVLAKILASAHRLTVSAVLARPLLLTAWTLSPLITALDGALIAPLARLASGSAREPPSSVTADELAQLLELGADAGQIDPDEQRLLSDVVQLGQRRVRDVMIPRADLAVLEAGDGADELLDLLRDRPVQIVPICPAGGLDAGVVGLLHTRRYLARAPARERPLAEDVQPPLFVPEQARLDQLLDQLNAAATDAALCVDEHAQITGLVLVEHVVAELLDQSPQAGPSGIPAVQHVGPGQWLVSGRLPARDWIRLLRIDPVDQPIADARVSTLAGLVMVGLGRIPVAGDELAIGNIRLRVETMTGRSIDRIRVSLDEPPASGPEARS